MSGEDTETTRQNIHNLILSASLMTIPGLIANSLSFYCIIPDLKKKKTIVKQLVLSLCFTDVVGCIGVCLFQAMQLINDVPVWICGCLTFVTIYVPMLSGAIATFMAAERCAALRIPYWYQDNMFNWKFWTPFVSLACVITIICFFPLMGLGNIINYDTRGNVSVRSCGPFPDVMAKTMKESTFTVSYGIVGLVLVVANISLNVAVLRTLYVMQKRIHPFVRCRQDTSHEFEMTKMLLALSTTFLICWLPLNVQLVLVQQGIPKSATLDTIAHCLIGLNFVVDPLINLIVKRKYREKIKGIFLCKRRPEREIFALSGNIQLTRPT